MRRTSTFRSSNKGSKAERGWCIGFVLLFGFSSIFAVVISNFNETTTTGIVQEPEDYPEVELPSFRASGVNPNLTREGYTVTLSQAGASQLFDPAGVGSTSLWGLHVDMMRIAYYGTDDLWHEMSFQINEVGYRWEADGVENYLSSGRTGDFDTTGERPQSLLESLQWKKGYVPDRFYPNLRNRFWPDRAGNLPMDASSTMMLNWPEFHNTTAEEAWVTPNNASQVRGAIDYDDEIVFLARNGRKVNKLIWYQSYAEWPYRFEVDITDPVDGGHSWVYIFYSPAGFATAPTPRNQVANDFYQELSYIAPGETDQVSFDQTTLTILATNYRLAFDRYHAGRFNNLRITLPGLQASNIFSQFPKDFIQAQGQINGGGSSPYDAIQSGILFHYGASGTWYLNGPPGIIVGSLGGYPGSSNTQRDYDEAQMGLGVIYHRGNPDTTRHWAYGLQTLNSPLPLGWRRPLGTTVYEGRVPLWFANASSGSTEYLSSPPTVAIDGSIAIRARWERLDRTQEPFDTATPGRGHFWMDQNLYVRDAGTYVLLYRPYSPGFPATNSQNDVFGMTNPNWADRAATIDGPVMVYIERMTSLKASASMEWLRQIDATYFDLLTPGSQATDGFVLNSDYFQQSDVIVFPNKLESRNNRYPTIQLPDIMYAEILGMRFNHVFGNFKTMQFDPAISTSTKIYLGPGATTTDATYGATMSLFADSNSAWINARNFPHYYNIPQVTGDGTTATTENYEPWQWMDEIPAVPATWYATGARVYTLDGSPSNDDVNYTARSYTMQDGSTRDYHPWWDYSGTDQAYMEQWLGTASWRAHIRTRVQDITSGRTQGWSTEYEPCGRTPRNQQTNVMSDINYPSDWYIVQVPGGGDVWVYCPVREIFEAQSAGYTRATPFQPPAAAMNYDTATLIKDSDMKEIGTFAARLTYGGSVIPFTLTWVFNNWGITNATNALAVGKREWVRNRLNLDSIFLVTRQTGILCVKTFSPVSHGSFYKPGDTVLLEIISNWNTAAVTFRTAVNGIISSPSFPMLATGPVALGSYFYRHTVSFTWMSSPTENVGPGLAPRYDYYWVYAELGSPVQCNLSCGLLYDDVVPTPASFTIPALTPSPAVVIDWSANKGSDNSDNTFPAPNNDGVKEYVIYRGGTAIATVPYGTFAYVDDGGTTPFVDGQVLSYVLRTVDQAGNYADSTAVTTTIALPILHPAKWNAQFNGDLAGPGVDDNPTAAYGNTVISWSLGAPYSGTITSFEIMRSTSLASGYTTIATGIGPTTYNYTINWASPASVADTYWYKVVSRWASGTIESAPMAIIYDKQPNGQPLPALIAWSAGPTYSPTERRIPIDITGSGRAIDPGWIAEGEPINTGSGIWRYLVYRTFTDDDSVWPNPWTLVGIVDRETMESDVWYHNDATLINGRYYRYFVQAQDFASPFPSLTYPNGMVNSTYIEFQFDPYIPDKQLRVQSVVSNVETAIQGDPFTISVRIANVGMSATVPIALIPIVTQGGIDMSAAFVRSGPVPALGSITSGGYMVYNFTFTPNDVDPKVLGGVLFSAQVTWSGGSHTFSGDPAVVNITEGCHCPIITISSLVVATPRVDPGPYIGGETMTLVVTYSNTGGTAATNVDATIDDGAYMGLTLTANPAAVNVPVGTATQTFSIPIMNTAVTATVTLTVSWTADGGYSGYSTLIVNIQSQANITASAAITAPRANPGPYVAGETMTLVVTYTNTGGTAATVDATIDDGLYTGLTMTDNPSAVMVPGGGLTTQVFSIPILQVAATASVTITITWTGTEAISGRPISGGVITLPLIIGYPASITASAAIVTPRAGPGPYVAGETMTLVVTYTNTGGTEATVDATIDDGVYTGLTLTANPAGVTIPASDTATQTFSVPILQSAAAQSGVVITFTWTGTEAYSGDSLGGSTTVTVNIQSQAAIELQSVVLDMPLAYPGTTVTALIGVTNTGGTTVNTGSVVLAFNATYAPIQTPINSTGLTIAAGATIYAQISFVVNAAEPTFNWIQIQAAFTGTEQCSGRTVTDSAANTAGLVYIPGCGIIPCHTVIGGRSTYIRGADSFIVRATIDNSGGVNPINAGELSIDFQGATGLLANITSYSGFTIAAGAVMIFYFEIAVEGSATTCNLRTHLTGNNGAAMDMYSTVTAISTVDPAAVSIMSTILSPIAAPGPYVGGMIIMLNVTFQNTAASGAASATVDAVIDDGAYDDLTWNDPSAVTVNVASTASQVFTINIDEGATTSLVTIAISWTGTIQYSGAALSGSTNVDVNIQSQSSVTIQSLALDPPSPGPYPHSTSFTMTVMYYNAGGTSATVDASVDDGAYDGLSWNNPAAVVVAAGNTKTQMFIINVGPASLIQAGVEITTTWAGTEAITNRIINGDVTAHTILANITGSPGLRITSIAYTTGTGTYIGGESFTVEVAYRNMGTSYLANLDAVLSFNSGSYLDIVQSNPDPISVTAGGTGVQSFTLDVNPDAISATGLIIGADWTGTDLGSGLSIGGNAGTNTETVDIQSQASITASAAITAPRAAPGPYGGGETMTLVITYINPGGTAATVDATIDDGTYTGLTLTDNPAAVTVPALGSITQIFGVPILNTAATQTGVIITTTWSGTEAITGRVIDGSTNLSITICCPPTMVAIISMEITSPRAAPGPYIGGETVTLVITYTNAGGTAATNVDATLSDGTYAGLLLADNPDPITVPAGGTNTQTFSIPILASAAMQTGVIITASWTADGNLSGSSTGSVNIQSQASITISGMAITTPRTNPGPYIGGESMTLVFTYANAGGTAATCDATIDDGTYTGLTLTDNPAAVTVPALGSITQTFGVPILNTAATRTGVIITATWSGTEATTNRVLASGTGTFSVNIQSQASITASAAITSPRAAPGPYGGGETMTLVITYMNPGGTAATVDATIDDGSYTGLSLTDNPDPATVPTSGTITQTFSIPVTGTTALVTLTATWIGIEAITGRVINGSTNLPITISCPPKMVAIISMEIISPRAAPGPYIGGETIILMITFGNTGGTAATVDATIDDGTYTGLLLTANPDAVTVAAGNAATQTFIIPILTGASTAVVTLTATWTGTETLSGSPLAGGTSTFAVTIQSQAIVSITSFSLNVTTAPVGEWVLALVTVRNTGGTAVANGTVVLAFFNATSEINQVTLNQSTGLALSAGGVIGVQIRFQIPADEPAGDVIWVQAYFSGTEAFSGAAVSDASADIQGVIISPSTGSPDDNTDGMFIGIIIIAGFTLFSCGITVFVRSKRHRRAVPREI